MSAEMVRSIATEAFADAIDILSIIETLEAETHLRLLPPSTRRELMPWHNASIGRCGRGWS
jgi:hypothetical protein